MSGAQGRFLYARVAPFADCEELSLPSHERVLCPTQPVGQRLPVSELLWSEALSPLNRLAVRPGKGERPRIEAENARDDMADDFARRVIRHQPGAYARAVASDILRAFAPTRTTAPGEFGAPPWEFQPAHSTS